MPSFTKLVPEGDNRPRDVCDTCGYVAYDNPKIVVGAVIAVGNSVLLCRRAIEPRLGFWTVPAGYLEHGETVAEGAAREAFEEAGATIRMDGVLALYSISRIGQVQIMFRAGFAGPVEFQPGIGEPGRAPVLLGRDPMGRIGVSFRSLGARGLAGCGRSPARTAGGQSRQR